MIESKSVFCIAYAIRKSNSTLKSLILEGNPVGSAGMRFLVQALNESKGAFSEMSIKEIGAAEMEGRSTFSFNPNQPEGAYSINLQEVYDQIVLQTLLDIDERIVESTKGEEESALTLRDCFITPKLGPSAFSLPTLRDSSVKWDLGDLSTLKPGQMLTFIFILNPLDKAAVTTAKEQSAEGIKAPEKLDSNIDQLIFRKTLC
jgi:hypothetical protein